MRRALILLTFAVLLTGCGDGSPPDTAPTATWDATQWNASVWAE